MSTGRFFLNPAPDLKREAQKRFQQHNMLCCCDQIRGPVGDYRGDFDAPVQLLSFEYQLLALYREEYEALGPGD